MKQQLEDAFWSILFNNKLKKINHNNNVIISQKINEVQIIIKS